MPPQQRRTYSDLVSRYKADLQGQRAELDRAAAASARDDLLGGRAGAGSGVVDAGTHDKAVRATTEAKRCVVRGVRVQLYVFRCSVCVRRV